MQTWDIWVPFPVSVNAYYNHVNHRTFRSQRGKLYADACLIAVRQKFRIPLMLTCNVAATFVLFPPDKRVRDESNYSKSLWDALSHAPDRSWHGAGLLLDDRQILRSSGMMGEVVSRKDSCCHVILEECNLPRPTLKEELLYYPRSEL